jgi:signal transduction histidine kinase
MSNEARFARVVALACHDLRTPLATVHGFARTLARVELGEPADRYIGMIEAASDQISELLDELTLVTRIEAGRFEPRLQTVDSLGLAREAASELHDDAVEVEGEGAPVSVEVDSTRRALRQLARASRRHGGLESVTVTVRGPELSIAPLAGTAPGVVTGEDLRELGAAAAVDLVRAIGGSVEADGDRLVIVLPEG